MKFPRTLAVIPLVLAVALFAASCVSTESPEGWAAPVFDDTTIYFTSSHNRLAAAPIPGADPTTNIKWTFPDKTRDKETKLQGIYGEPVLDADRIYLTSYSGGVFALNKDNGVPIWPIKGDKALSKDSISGNVVSGPAIGGDLLVFGTTDGHLYALNKSDGSPAASWPKGGIKLSDGVWATPIIKGDDLWVATMAGDLYKLKLSDGSKTWDKPFHTTGAIPDLAMLDDTRLFVPSLNKHVYLVDAGSGEQLGEFAASDWVWTRPAFANNSVYFGDFGGHIYALDITTGLTKKWSQSPNGARIKSAPEIVDDVLVLADRKPAVHFLKPETGELINSVPVPAASTFRADAAQNGGFAYLVGTNGKLFRADPKKSGVVEIIVGGRQ